MSLDATHLLDRALMALSEAQQAFEAIADASDADRGLRLSAREWHATLVRVSGDAWERSYNLKHPPS